jgi:hypothetical protein
MWNSVVHDLSARCTRPWWCILRLDSAYILDYPIGDGDAGCTSASQACWCASETATWQMELERLAQLATGSTLSLAVDQDMIFLDMLLSLMLRNQYNQNKHVQLWLSLLKILRKCSRNWSWKVESLKMQFKDYLTCHVHRELEELVLFALSEWNCAHHDISCGKSNRSTVGIQMRTNGFHSIHTEEYIAR